METLLQLTLAIGEQALLRLHGASSPQPTAGTNHEQGNVMTTSTLTTTPRNFNCPVTEVGCTDSRCIQRFCAWERDEREEAERAAQATAERMERHFGPFWDLLKDL